MTTEDLIRQLSEASGISGRENEVAALVRQSLADSPIQSSVDRMGSLHLRLEGHQPEPRPCVMIAAHMDEIGLVVTSVEKGFIRFSRVGGIDVRSLPGQRVIVHASRDLPGVIGFPPPHVVATDSQDRFPPLHELFIDVGLAASDVESLVHTGDMVSFDRQFTRLSGDMASGKALDNRAGVAALTQTMRDLVARRPLWDVVGVATTQEEIGLFGARTSAFSVKPDIAVAIDVTFGDYPGVDTSETVALGKGPTLHLGPNFSPVVYRRLIDTAKKLEIPCQTQAIAGPSGTDAWAIQVARGGVATALVSIPLRNMHSTAETVSCLDIDRTARLLAGFISSLDDDIRGRLIPEV